MFSRRNFLRKSALASLLGAGFSSGHAIAKTSLQDAPYNKHKIAVDVDVLVCGGGCAGVAAAISAARRGANVALIERFPSIGGMAINAMVNTWHTSDREKVVILGLVGESVERASKRNWIFKYNNFPLDQATYWFEPEGMRIIWQQMLREAGVRTFCYLTAGEPIIDGNQIKGVLADTKTGRKAFMGKIVIDCTGDGDIAAKAGLPFSYGRESDGLGQNMTMYFTLRGIDVAAKKLNSNEKIDEIMDEMTRLHNEGLFPAFKYGNTRSLLRGGGNFNSWNVNIVHGNALDEEELTRLTEISREQIIQYIDFWREKVPGMENAELNRTGCSIGIRESRRIKGIKTLDKTMVLDAVRQPDAVGHGVWMIDIHDPKGTGYTTFRDQNIRTKLMTEVGESYHIPLGIALNDQIPNLAVACRAASTTHEGHASFRVQSHIMALAQGVGTCAAMALDANTTMKDVNISKLQQVLKSDGVYLEDVPGN